MPRRPEPLPPQLGPTFRTGHAVAAGVSPRRLRSDDLDAPFHGVRIRREGEGTQSEGTGAAGTDPLAIDRAARERSLRAAHAYAAVMPTGAMFCGRTAAVLLGLPVTPGPFLEVAAVAPLRAPRARGIRGRKVEPHLVTMCLIDGLPVSDAASTWAMLGRELSVRELVVVGDAIVQVPRGPGGRPRPDGQQATPEQLRAAATAGRRHGAARLAAASDLIRIGSMSPLETRFRLDAAAARLPPPDLDVEIRDVNGLLLGISEIVYRQWRVVVELEGDHHRTNRRQWVRDIDKYAAYAAAGWETVRLTSAHLQTGAGVARVEAALRRRGWRPGLSAAPAPQDP